jgi:phosphohistidine phosphatase SixA
MVWLSEQGHLQGRILSKMWSEINKADDLYEFRVSPYLRTQQTADYITANYITDLNLIE